jgi:hypothetical protein
MTSLSPVMQVVCHLMQSHAVPTHEDISEETVALDLSTYHLDVGLRTASDNSLSEVDIQTVLEPLKLYKCPFWAFMIRVGSGRI